MAKAPNKDGEPPSDLVGDLFHAVNDVANSPRNAEKTAEAASGIDRSNVFDAGGGFNSTLLPGWVCDKTFASKEAGFQPRSRGFPEGQIATLL